MEKEFVGGLGEMLRQSNTAKEYFASLPEYIQGMILQRSDHVRSEQELRRYAENLLQGDK